MWIREAAGMRKTLPTVAFILALWLSAVAGVHFVGLAHANPFMYYGSVSPPADASPLIISVSSPKNNTIYSVNSIKLTFNLNTSNTSIHYLLAAYFEADWLQENVTVYKQNVYSPEFPNFWNYKENFCNLSDGEHSVVIYARGGGGYAEGLTYNFFDMTTISVIDFTIDTTPPSISSFSVENKTYSTSDVPLTITVNEPVSQVSYSLNGQKNVTVSGNTTLTDLPNGNYNVVVYATDLAGHVGASEIIAFTVSKPDLTIIAATVSIVLCVGLSVYFKKRKH
jgi:hypothetical protein